MASNIGDTYAEGMKKVLSQLAEIGTLPDADTEFLMGIQQAITQQLRDQAAQATQAQIQGSQAPTQQMASMGMPDPSGGGAPPFGPSGGGAPMQGLGASVPNMDELSRVLGRSGSAQ